MRSTIEKVFLVDNMHIGYTYEQMPAQHEDSRKGVSMRKLHGSSYYTKSRRRGFSPLVLVGVLVTVVIALGVGGVVFLLPRIGSHAAGAANADCTLIVPAHPLTAAGLGTPF